MSRKETPIQNLNLDKFTGREHKGEKEMYSSMPLTDYITKWMETFKSGSVKPATYARLETSLTAIQPYSISQMQIKDITAFDI